MEAVRKVGERRPKAEAAATQGRGPASKCYLPVTRETSSTHDVARPSDGHMESRDDALAFAIGTIEVVRALWLDGNTCTAAARSEARECEKTSSATVNSVVEAEVCRLPTTNAIDDDRIA